MISLPWAVSDSAVSPPFDAYAMTMAGVSEWSVKSLSDARRRAVLETPLAPEALVAALAERIEQAATSNVGIRFGWEQRQGKLEHCRATIQFAVGAELFDQFFNARTGYRAHFQQHYKCGLRFNNLIIAAAIRILEANLSQTVPCRRLALDDDSVKDCGAVEVPLSDIIRSLEPYMSRVWWCAHRIRPEGGLEDLPYGFEDQVEVAPGVQWSAPYRDEDDAWLEIKGRFLGLPRWDQGKKLLSTRAKDLQRTGCA